MAIFIDYIFDFYFQGYKNIVVVRISEEIMNQENIFN